MASTTTAAFRQGIYKSALVRKVTRWLDASAHPPLALEIAPNRVAGARWTRTGSLDGFAVHELPDGALVPSAVESNIVNPGVVTAAVKSVFERLRAKDRQRGGGCGRLETDREKTDVLLGIVLREAQRVER